MKEAVIVTALRTAVGKAPKGTLRYTRPDDMAAAVLQECVKQTPGLDPAEIEDVIIGCAMPEAEQGVVRGFVLRYARDDRQRRSRSFGRYFVFCARRSGAEVRPGHPRPRSPGRVGERTSGFR